MRNIIYIIVCYATTSSASFTFRVQIEILPCLGSLFLSNYPQQAKYFKQDFMKTLVSEWRGQNVAWEGMLTLVQSASALSFAVRAPSHNDEELKQLHTHALDMVR